jgi:hypothetical protein
MPAWATVVLTLGVSAIAVAGTLAATWLQHRFATQQRREAEWVGLRDRGAKVFGPIEVLLADTDPDRLVGNQDVRSSEWRDEIKTRWRTIRDELAVYANAHSVTDVGIAIRRLSDAVGRAITSSLTAVMEPSDRVVIETAQSDRERARALLEVVAAATRNDFPPREAAIRAAEVEGTANPSVQGSRDAEPARLR